MKQLDVSEFGLTARAVETCQLSIVVVDVRAECSPIVYANEAFERLTGYGHNEIMGRNCRFLQRGGRDHRARAKIRVALAEGDACHTVLWNFRKNGTKFLNELHLSPIRNQDGCVTHYFGCQRELDLHEFRKLLDEAREPLTNLTARECQVFAHLVKGNSTKEVARSLSISPRTAEKHRQNLLRKLNVSNVVELVNLTVPAQASVPMNS